MKINLKSYPHPVLGNGDDLSGVFSVDFRYELSKQDVALICVFDLKSKAVEELIKKGKASFIVEAECTSTFYRNGFSTQKTADKFIIPSKLLRERVTVGFYICSNEEIANYQPSDCHPDYKGLKFDIEKGDVLAVGGYCSFIAEKEFDPMRPPLSSFVAVVEGIRHTGPMEIDYSSDKITIELSKADYKNYCDTVREKAVQGVIHASIVLPVLADAIYQVNGRDNDHADRNWFGRLESILESKGLANKPPLEAAQIILESPMARNFESILSLLNFNNTEEV